MAIRTSTFPVQLARETDVIALAVRTGIANKLRDLAQRRVRAADLGGIDRDDVSRKLAFDWIRTTRASRLCRNVNGDLVAWAVSTAFDCPYDVPPNTVGEQHANNIDFLPGDVAVITMGGLRATGIAVGRCGETPDVVMLTSYDSGEVDCTLIFNIPRGRSEVAPAPELETESR
jgi:hypothetical protein